MFWLASSSAIFALLFATLVLSILGSGIAAFSPTSTLIHTPSCLTAKLRVCSRRRVGGQFARSPSRGQQLKMAEDGLYSPFWEHTASVLKGMGGAISSYPIPDG